MVYNDELLALATHNNSKDLTLAMMSLKSKSRFVFASKYDIRF